MLQTSIVPCKCYCEDGCGNKKWEEYTRVILEVFVRKCMLGVVLLWFSLNQSVSSYTFLLTLPSSWLNRLWQTPWGANLKIHSSENHWSLSPAAWMQGMSQPDIYHTVVCLRRYTRALHESKSKWYCRHSFAVRSLRVCSAARHGQFLVPVSCRFWKPNMNPVSHRYFSRFWATRTTNNLRYLGKKLLWCLCTDLNAFWVVSTEEMLFPVRHNNPSSAPPAEVLSLRRTGSSIRTMINTSLSICQGFWALECLVISKSHCWGSQVTEVIGLTHNPMSIYL